MKFAWAVIRNIIVLAIAIAIFTKAESGFEKIVFSLLVMIYLGIETFRLTLGMVISMGYFSFCKELWQIKKLFKETGISNTTLNPVFPEEIIRQMKNEEDKYGRDSNRLFNRLHRKEREEIKAYHETGKDKSLFEPSATLLRIIREYSQVITIRNLAHDNIEKMVKANLAVLNGKPIEEVKESCKLNDIGVLGLHKGEYDPEEFVKSRKEHWEKSWDHILESEGLLFPEYETITEKEEKEIREVEKAMNKAWIKVYIEGSFMGIIFFVALWHLLRGLQIF